MLMGHLSWIRVIKKTLNEGIVYKLSKKSLLPTWAPLILFDQLKVSMWKENNLKAAGNIQSISDIGNKLCLTYDIPYS